MTQINYFIFFEKIGLYTYTIRKNMSSRHLSQIRKRHKLPKDAEVTLELLAEKSGVALSDLKSIYDKVKRTKATKGHAADELQTALDHLSEQVGLEKKDKPTKKKIVAKGTVKKPSKGSGDELPEGSPELKKEKAVKPKVELSDHEAGMLRVYQFVNQLERYKDGKVKTIPAPKKIALRYIEQPAS